MATVTTFTIIKGKETSFEINIKENGTTTPLVLQPADTFFFSLVDKKTNVKYVDNKQMIIVDLLNGKVAGLLTAVETASLPVKVSSSEDGYIPRAGMRLVVYGTTEAQGDMSATIENIYVMNG